MDLADGLKQLSRMCAKYHEICDDCPLNGKDFCSLEPADRDAEINVRAAAIIEKWADGNPELIYQTWWEWLENMGIVSKARSDSKIFDTTRMYDPIPTDIAQKLGIEPKEVK